MKTCLVFGHGGLDLDVALNVVDFYKSLGFITTFSDKLFQADILIILRAIDSKLNLSKFNFQIIHVYDYGGWNYDKCISSLNFKITYIITTSIATKSRIKNNLFFPENQIFVAMPPINTTRWIHDSQGKLYKYVHIGHYKGVNQDIVQKKFNKVLIDFNVQLWGLGWNKIINSNNYHGKAGLFEVSKIYSKSNFAFGIMYPFQRNVTFSGRFWHAPLNGCYLFSEKGLYTSIIPGVIETDFDVNDIALKLSQNLDHNLLKIKSKKFWDEEWEKNRTFISPTIENLVHQRTTMKNILLFKKERIINYFRIYYQKFNLFKLFQSF